MARGDSRTVDQKLEASGLFLHASTQRDTMSYRIDAPLADVGLAVSAMQDLLSGVRLTDEEIKREAEIIRQELALIGPRRALRKSIWTAAYGENRLDPLGDPDVMATATPKQIQDLHQTHFCAANLVVLVVGNIDTERGIAIAKQIASEAPAFPLAPLEWQAVPAGKPATASASGMTSIGLPVTGFQEPETVAAVAAGFALASLAEGEIGFTPSYRSGLVSVIFPYQDKVRPAFEQSPQAAFSLGVLLAKAWIESQLSDPAQAAMLRGTLLANAQIYRPEGFLDALAILKPSQFEKAWNQLRDLARPE